MVLVLDDAWTGGFSVAFAATETTTAAHLAAAAILVEVLTVDAEAAALVTACAADAVPALAAALTAADASPVVPAAPPQCCYWPLLGLWAAAHLLSLFLLLALAPTTATCSGNGRKPGEKDQ